MPTICQDLCPTVYIHYLILVVILGEKCHDAHFIIEEIKVQGGHIFLGQVAN